MSIEHPSAGTEPDIGTLRLVTNRLAALIEGADLDSPVPACPMWVVEDLVRHIGEVHAWAAGAVRTMGAIEVPSSDRIRRQDLAAWYRERAGDLVDLLAEVGPLAPAWVFGPVAGEGTASFWIRRQVHETLMHTWDVLAAHGTAEPIDAALAWDGVEEVRDVFYPRQVALGRVEPLPGALHLEAVGLDRDPVVIGFGEPRRVQQPPSDMLLALWHRKDLVGVTDEVRDLLAGALTP